jgi:hypothetical protein
MRRQTKIVARARAHRVAGLHVGIKCDHRCALCRSLLHSRRLDVAALNQTALSIYPLRLCWMNEHPMERHTFICRIIVNNNNSERQLSCAIVTGFGQMLHANWTAAVRSFSDPFSVAGIDGKITCKFAHSLAPHILTSHVFIAAETSYTLE